MREMTISAMEGLADKALGRVVVGGGCGVDRS